LKFSSWIYRIAHNHVISRHRAKLARPQTTAINTDIYQNLAGELDLHYELERQETKAQVLETINQLKPEHRELLYLKYIEEKSYEELSDILAKPMGTVASLIHSAKKSFKKIWNNKYGTTN
jgi:RNA polymerase sigma-70 factor (ECF subfamily)